MRRRGGQSTDDITHSKRVSRLVKVGNDGRIPCSFSVTFCPIGAPQTRPMPGHVPLNTSFFLWWRGVTTSSRMIAKAEFTGTIGRILPIVELSEEIAIGNLPVFLPLIYGFVSILWKGRRPLRLLTPMGVRRFQSPGRFHDRCHLGRSLITVSSANVSTTWEVPRSLSHPRTVR
jgi:hypothetical protein